MATRVMILAGGTGGHVYPALAVAKELMSRECEVRWMGTLSGLEARVVPDAGIAIDWLSVAGFRGKGWRAKCAAPFKLTLAMLQAASHLLKFRPDVVLGMGGFVAGPGGVMARLLGIPLVIHEQNRVPGTTNRFLVKFSRVVLEAFPHSFPASVNAHCVGNPLRKELLTTARVQEKRHGSPLKLLILGGSQGAKALNQIVPKAIGKYPERFLVRHQTGQAMQKETERAYREMSVSAEVMAFIEDMGAAYCWADLVICRSGAMTVSELAATGLPAILIPFPFAIDDHQTANARFLADQGAAVLLPQAGLDPDSLIQVMNTLLSDTQKLNDMSKVARSLAQPEAAQRVCDIALAEVRQ